MDINDARVITTVMGLFLFLGIVGWAWSKQRRSSFDEAARLPLIEGDAPAESAGEPQ
jgi:cytochrome c oxidase cbb3-type subunit 4